MFLFLRLLIFACLERYSRWPLRLYVCLFVSSFRALFFGFVCLSVGFVSLPSLFRYVQLCACFLRLYSLVNYVIPYVSPSDGTDLSA